LLGSGAVAFVMNRSLDLIARHGRKKHERVMQLVCVCRFRPRFFFDFFNCSSVENAEPIATPAAAGFRSASRVNGLSPAFFQGRVI